jgi:hypothetical protein
LERLHNQEMTQNGELVGCQAEWTTRHSLRGLVSDVHTSAFRKYAGVMPTIWSESVTDGRRLAWCHT